MTQRQFPKFKDDQTLCSFLLEMQLLPFLAALAEKTVDPGLLSSTAYLLLMVTNYRPGGRTQAVDFLAVLFKRMQDIYQQNFNPITHGIKRTRRRSTGATEGEGFGQLVQKINRSREDMTQLAVLLLNFCLGTVSEAPLTKDTRLAGEDSLHLLRCFMPVAGSVARSYVLTALAERVG